MRMARPRKFKRVCCLPEVTEFGPLNRSINPEVISMSVEEYEVLRIIDLEGYTQEECAQSMGVARTTIQRIYDDARKKLAESVINGKILQIEGGDYRLCGEEDDLVFPCTKRSCCRRRNGNNVEV